MPRRSLLFLAALVLALHWLVLQGLPLGANGAMAPTPAPVQIFSTRSIAPPPAPVVAPPAAEPAKARPAAVRPKPRLKPRPPQPTPPQPPPAPPPSDQALVPVPEDLALNQTADPAAAAATAEVADAGAPAASAAPIAPASTPEQAAPPAESSIASAASKPPGADASTADPGVEILAPGHSTRSSATRQTPPPVRIPDPVRLAFNVNGRVKGLAYSARAQLLWQHDGSRYQARQEISVFLVGTRTQTSVGQITPQGLQPERFADKARSEQAAHFNYAQGRVTFSANTPDAPIGPGAQDRLSIFIQLGALLAADPARFVPGTRIALLTVGPRNADRWAFTIEGQETLDLPVGPTPAWRLARLPQHDYDQKSELWLAPGLAYLPVRIRVTQANGDFVDLRLRSSDPP